MRVLYWSELFWPHIGGVEVFGMQLLDALRSRGHDLIVLTSHVNSRLPELDSFHDIPVHRLAFRQALANRDLKTMAAVTEAVRDLTERFSPDVVHFNFSGPSGFFYLRAVASLAVPTIVTVHYTPEVGSMGLVAQMMRAATWVVGVSAAVLSTVRALLPEIASRSSILYNGLALPERLPSAVSFDPPQLLCIGRLVPEKGFDVALHALAAMRRTRPDVRMVVAGDGPERAALIGKATGLGLTDIVKFTGWVHPDSVPALIDASTMVLVPSRWEEPFGLVAVEAGQMARPTVASRVGGLPEIVVEGRTGLLVTKENPEQLATAALSLLDDPIGAQRMGEAARAHVRLRFGLERFVDEYEMLYRQVGRA